MDIIKALQQNKEPFGLMSTDEFSNEEMQVKAREIEKGAGDWFLSFNGKDWVNASHIVEFATSHTYRLCPGYEEPKAGIIECEVKLNRHGLHFVDNEGRCQGLQLAISDPDFIGFKYNDDRIKYKHQRLCGSPRVYLRKSDGLVLLEIDFENIEDFAVLTPTAVLFKES